MKLISWNTNGIRACLNKGFMDFFQEIDADIFAVQETKMQEGQIEIDTKSYYQYYDSAVKKGYSGIGIEEHDQEGRVVTLEFEKFYFVNVYVPNSKEKLLRLEYRMKWEDDFRKYLLSLKSNKSVIVCGDLNVAHNEIDLKNPDTNHFSAGFSDEERNKFTELLNSGFIDTFRYLHEDKVKYSWWSFRTQARQRNVGWRIDYFLVSEDLKENIKKADILDEVYGSDHCPVLLELDI